MTLHPVISIMIPTKNNEDTIENCMKSLAGLKYPEDRYETIIVDGHSKDRTVAIAERYGAKIFYEEGGTRAAACNVGLSHVHGDYVAFTDADCIVDTMWLANALKYFEETAVAGVGGPNIVPDDVVSFGKAIDFVLSHTIFSAGATYAKRLGVPTEVESIGGCNAIYQTTVLKAVFPINEIPTAEDALLNHRIRLKGLRLIDAPDVVVWHYRHWDTPKLFFRRMTAYARGRVQAGRIHREMVKPMHKLAGFSLPVMVLAMTTLFFMSNSIFFAVVSIGIFILLFFSGKCLYETKSPDVALLVPLVIMIEWIGWSIGYVKETFT